MTTLDTFYRLKKSYGRNMAYFSPFSEKRFLCLKYEIKLIFLHIIAEFTLA